MRRLLNLSPSRAKYSEIVCLCPPRSKNHLFRLNTKCPCKKFSGILEQVKQKYGDKVAIYSIVTMPDTMQQVKDYIAANKVSNPILFDSGQVMASYLKLTPQNPTVTFPHAFLIDRNGVIKNDFVYGPATSPIFEGNGLFGEIDKLLAAK